MFRNDRYFNKNDGQHNYYGVQPENLESLNLQTLSGHRKPLHNKKPPSQKKTSSPKRKSG